MNYTILIADLHLSAETPELNQLLIHKLTEWQKTADALYMLGDIYNAWIGDENLPSEIIRVNQALLQFAQTKPLYLMQGNRDFLIDEAFAQTLNAILLPDPTVVSLYNKPHILSHGDIMCTDDIKYQRYRKIVRSRLFKTIVSKLPNKIKQRIAHKFRQVSRKNKENPQQYIISDVTEIGLKQMQDCFMAIAPLDIMHGHTHKPAIHQHTYHEKCYTRLVIPDWHKKQGGCITVYADNTYELNYFKLK